MRVMSEAIVLVLVTTTGMNSSCSLALYSSNVKENSATACSAFVTRYMKPEQQSGHSLPSPSIIVKSAVSSMKTFGPLGSSLPMLSVSLKVSSGSSATPSALKMTRTV